PRPQVVEADPRHEGQIARDQREDAGRGEGDEAGRERRDEGRDAELEHGLRPFGAAQPLVEAGEVACSDDAADDSVLRGEEQRRRQALQPEAGGLARARVEDARVLPAPAPVEGLRAASRVLDVEAKYLGLRVGARESAQIRGLLVAAWAPRGPDVD